MDPQLNAKLVGLALTSSHEARALRNLINGNKLSLSQLTTDDKSNLVSAINEIKELVDAGSSLDNFDILIQDYYILHPQFFEYEQNIPSDSLHILHPLDHLPEVSIIDSAGTVWRGDVSYPTSNQVLVQFNLPFTGKVILT